MVRFSCFAHGLNEPQYNLNWMCVIVIFWMICVDAYISSFLNITLIDRMEPIGRVLRAMKTDRRVSFNVEYSNSAEPMDLGVDTITTWLKACCRGVRALIFQTSTLKSIIEP